MAYSRVFDMIRHQRETRPKPDCLAAKVDGTWRKYSTDEVIAIMNKVSKALIGLGLQKDDKVAMVSNNRPEWNFLDLGMQQIGVVNVPVYPTISEREYKYIFNDAAVVYCFVSSNELYHNVSNIHDEVPSLQKTWTFDQLEQAPHWTELLEEVSAEDQAEIDRRAAEVSEDDLATLIYTSGTTGDPKGVMLTHLNLVSNVESVSQLLPLELGDRALSFLPLCHSFERTVSNVYLANGISIYYAESMETIGPNLIEIKPHFFSTVPRLLEKVYERIMEKGLSLTGFKRKLFFWSLELGSDFKLHDSQGPLYRAKLGIARKLVFSKWQEALGGNIVAIVTGAAAIQPRLATLFTAAGVPVLEGYGLTETAPVLSCNRMELENRAIGTVGLPIPGVEVKLGENDEIIARGPNIMRGYYGKPELTAEVIDADGWFHTGDKGEWVDGKFLKITDRIKELFKTSGGKYVAPQPIENKFKESPLIEQMATIGNDRKFVSALIVPSFLALEDFCKQRGIELTERETLLRHPDVLNEIQHTVDRYNENFSHVEQIKKFTLLPDEWSPMTGELTPTLKVKRKVIYERYGDEIEAMYR